MRAAEAKTARWDGRPPERGSTLGGHEPAGLTLRSSSRSAMAEVKVENKGRENLLFVLQAMHLDSEDVYDMPARHGPLTEFVTRSARALEQKGGGRLDLIFRCSCLKASAFLLSLSCSLFLVERRPISGAPATHQAPEHPCFWPCLAPGRCIRHSTSLPAPKARPFHHERQLARPCM